MDNTTQDSALSGLWTGEPLILASASVGRARLLANAGIPFETYPASLEERNVIGVDILPATDQARRLAAEKARLVSQSFPGRVVIGADQTLSVDDRVMHKAENVDQARQQLRSLRGRPHQLHSAVACMADQVLLFEAAETVTIEMRRYGERFLEAYVQMMGDRLLRTVGCYEVEGLGAQLIQRIDGDHFTVIGLPMFPFLAGLRRLGLIVEDLECS